MAPPTISIHALLAESDHRTSLIQYASSVFLSTLSLRRATDDQTTTNNGTTFLSTLSLRRATSDAFAAVSTLLISIHALLAESDGSPCMIWSNIFLFLSTLSLRRATTGTTSAKMPRWDFYPRSPCGERLQCHPPQPRPPFISIHALLAESDANEAATTANEALFLSTLSLRRATKSPANSGPRIRYFYPRSPCGERPGCLKLLVMHILISIHALLAESDSRILI